MSSICVVLQSQTVYFTYSFEDYDKHDDDGFRDAAHGYKNHEYGVKQGGYEEYDDRYRDDYDRYGDKDYDNYDDYDDYDRDRYSDRDSYRRRDDDYYRDDDYDRDSYDE